MNNFKLYGIVGKPVLHSLSPNIFNNLFEKNKINAKYIRIASTNEKDAVNTIKEVGVAGVNVTMPYKQSIMKYLSCIDPLSENINAVNTITVSAGKRLSGYNTDYYGVIRTLESLHLNIINPKCVVLGAGGAGRTAVYALTESGAEVTVINRTYEKALRLASEFKCKALQLSCLDDALQNVNVLVSTVPSNANILNDISIRPGLIVIDAVYNHSQLSSKAEALRFTYINGKEWLINQAVPVYNLFTGKTVDKKTIRRLINDAGKNMYQSISLIGFMGTGKTTIGKLLAEKLGYEFIDTDSYIEKFTGKKISEIFSSEGENAFRKYEKSALSKLVKVKRAVISCGGGLTLDKDNRALLKKHCLNIWLFSTVKSCLERTQPNSRPLLPVTATLQKADTLYGKRVDGYADASHILFRNKGASKIDTARNIYNEIISSDMV